MKRLYFLFFDKNCRRPCSGKRIFNVFLIIICSIIISNCITQAQVTNVKEEGTKWRESAVKVFLDLSHLVYKYGDYIKTEIPFVNFVRDVNLSQVYILITYQPTGSSGTEYTFTILGQKNFSNINDTLKYISKPGDTFEMRRSGMAHILKMGLMSYVAKTPLADDISITFKRKTKPYDAIAVKDRWNYWVFTLRTNGEVAEEKNRKVHKFNSSFSIRRETPVWKIRLNGNNNYTKDRWIVSDLWRRSIIESRGINVLIVKGFGEHWSFGGFGEVKKSPYYNTELSLSVGPSIEFNIFPYSLSTRREFRFLYNVSYINTEYEEETIYYKLHESLIRETLKATFEMKEKWGSITSTLEGAHYFPNSDSDDFLKDFFKYKHLRLSGRVSLRIFQGLSLTLSGSYSVIRDQLYLQKGSLPEYLILLRRKRLATDYDLKFKLGLSYTFGSIFSNVVNSRFGN